MREEVRMAYKGVRSPARRLSGANEWRGREEQSYKTTDAYYNHGWDGGWSVLLRAMHRTRFSSLTSKRRGPCETFRRRNDPTRSWEHY